LHGLGLGDGSGDEQRTDERAMHAGMLDGAVRHGKW
jgi:hypothetical protein